MRSTERQGFDDGDDYLEAECDDDPCAADEFWDGSISG